MKKELMTRCDHCGKEIKVTRNTVDGNTMYMIHGLFCINMPGFFCNKECFEETISEAGSLEIFDRDDEGRPIIDVDVMINETLLLDKMYDIVYEAENPLFPTLILQRVLAVDPENPKFLYGLSSLYVGLLAAENTPQEWKPKLLERLEEVATDLQDLSPSGYKRLLRLRQHYNV
ncbi:MAG TPA: hypothetical protein ENK09_04515 [Nitrospirae bacterium]|nr:hypothetical protein [Nitrospirota bacterium]